MNQDAVAYPRPLPELSGLTGEFYGFCKQGELRFQRCGSCRAWRHVPRELCPKCGSWDYRWEASCGRGVVFSWTVIARALHPAFTEDAPYACVIVELEEGVRLLSHVEGIAPADLAIDLPVQVCFDAVTDEVTLPKFRLVGA